MKPVRILAVGKLQGMYAPLQEEFLKRLSRYCRPELLEVADEQAPEKLSQAGKERVMRTEWERLRSHLKPEDYLIVLDGSGKKLDSVALSKNLEEWKQRGTPVFALGGSLGFCPEALQRADFRLSLSDMTFTHSMARVILLEQLYRAEKIFAGEPYHK